MLAGNWLHRARNTKPPFPRERGRHEKDGAVNRFAELLDALLFTPSRNGKLRLMQEYFATTPDPERGWALAALTGELGFAEAKPSQVRDLAMARVDPGAVRLVLGFRRRPRRDRGADLARDGERLRSPVPSRAPL